jgi:D-serine deaminase-like pyridoxal phosphate-dependent protein
VKSTEPIDFSRYPIGSRVRVLPNHACPTAAAHERYQVLAGGKLIGEWDRVNGW